MKRLMLTLAFALAGLGYASASQAETITFTCQPEGDWSNQDCWDLGRRPASGDDVFIPQFRTCNMDISAEVNSITLGTVQAQGGALNIQPGITLTIKADSTMYGPITLQGSGSTLRISPPGNSTLTMGGCCGGWIQGENANAVITVDQGDTFRTGGDGITIYGLMQVTGLGTFVIGLRISNANATRAATGGRTPG